MKIEFTPKQYEKLMQLVCLGNWVINSRLVKTLQEYDNVESYIYSFARDFGLDKYYREFRNDDGTKYSEVDMIEDRATMKYVDRYNEDTFWEELVDKLAHREIIKQYGRDKLAKMDAKEFLEKFLPIADKYEKIINAEGMEAIEVIMKKKPVDDKK